jgi:hypothetical protein
MLGFVLGTIGRAFWKGRLKTPSSEPKPGRTRLERQARHEPGLTCARSLRLRLSDATTVSRLVRFLRSNRDS